MGRWRGYDDMFGGNMRLGDVVAEASATHKHSVPLWFVVDPRRAKHLWIWDMLVAIALVTVALVTPFEVGFIEARSQIDGLFIMNRAIDLIFLADVALQFVRMVQVDSPRDGVIWLHRPCSIARHYLAKGWLAIDFLALAASVLEIADMIVGTSTTASLETLQVMRTLRVLRLVRLSRLITSLRLFKQWEIRIAVSYAALNVAKSEQPTF